MDQTFVIWVLIGLGLVTANLPFFTERHLLLLPWVQVSDQVASGWLRLLRALLFFVALAGAGWAINLFIGGAFFVLSNAVSVLLYLLRVVLAVVVVAAIMWVPGRLYRGHSVAKSVFVRLLEVLAFYVLVGTLGFAFEASIGNPFNQSWEFYVVTLCLFVVLGYPGFVYRYLMRRRRAQPAS